MKKNKYNFTIEDILKILNKVFPNSKSSLIHKNVFQLLIGVMLSAQSTDKQVNKITVNLFEKYKSVNDFANANLEELENEIKSIGLYKTKAKNIIETSKMLIKDYNGKVPNTREELMTLPGVGRKTANVVLSQGFDEPAIAVDTHISRIAKRLGIANENDSVKVIEEKLMKAIPKNEWSKAHINLLLFGRYYSTARNKENPFDILEKLKKEYVIDKKKSPFDGKKYY